MTPTIENKKHIEPEVKWEQIKQGFTFALINYNRNNIYIITNKPNKKYANVVSLNTGRVSTLWKHDILLVRPVKTKITYEPITWENTDDLHV